MSVLLTVLFVKCDKGKLRKKRRMFDDMKCCVLGWYADMKRRPRKCFEYQRNGCVIAQSLHTD